MNREQLIDKLERIVCGVYPYEIQELAHKWLCSFKGAPQNCAKFPMARPVEGKVVSCWDEGGVFLGNGISTTTANSGAAIAINGKVYDSNHVLLWNYASPLSAKPPAAFEMRFDDVAALRIDGESMTFTGNADAAAMMFFDNVIKTHSEQWKAMQARLDKQEESRAVAVVHQCLGTDLDGRKVWSVKELQPDTLEEENELFPDKNGTSLFTWGKFAELWECTDCGHLYDGEISLCDCHGPNAHKLKKYRATLVEVE